MPKVSLKKIEPPLKQSIDVEVFPGEVHKPIITFVNTHNYQWGDYDHELCVPKVTLLPEDYKIPPLPLVPLPPPPPPPPPPKPIVKYYPVNLPPYDPIMVPNKVVKPYDVPYA